MRETSTLGLGIGAEDKSVKSIYYDGILTLVFIIIVLDDNVGWWLIITWLFIYWRKYFKENLVYYFLLCASKRLINIENINPITFNVIDLKKIIGIMMVNR